jgi:hypothetical protein
VLIAYQTLASANRSTATVTQSAFVFVGLEFDVEEDEQFGARQEIITRSRN